MNVGSGGTSDRVDDVGENVADDGSQPEQDSDHDDGDQHQNERVLYEPLSIFT